MQSAEKPTLNQHLIALSIRLYFKLRQYLAFAIVQGENKSATKIERRIAAGDDAHRFIPAGSGRLRESGGVGCEFGLSCRRCPQAAQALGLGIVAVARAAAWSLARCSNS